MRNIQIRPSRLLHMAANMFGLVAVAISARADIHQWEYVNPADPGQGKRQSSTLVPDGAGVDAVPGADFLFRDLTMAYVISADLTGADAAYANLTDADLSHANLTNARLYFANLTGANLSNANLINAYVRGATLTGADFTGAEIRGANFVKTEDAPPGTPCCGNEGSGLTLDQLYSTASYVARDISGVNLSHYDLSAGNFVGQNLANADFTNATITNADFTDADVRGANFAGRYKGFTLAQLYSTSSYKAQDLRGIRLRSNDLTGANFAGQDLTNAVFGQGGFISATLTGADFTGAQVRGADFTGATRSGFTMPQLYSTASYKVRDLAGIILSDNDLTGANFAGQDLTAANFWEAELGGLDFSNANLSNANFSYATLAGAEFTGAIIQGAHFYAAYVSPDLLYSTASYKARNLAGVILSHHDLAGANFAQQDLTNATFSAATLTGVDFTNANITDTDFAWAALSGAVFRGANLGNANFVAVSYFCFPIGGGVGGPCSEVPFTYFTPLTDADLTAADARGASGLNVSDAITANLIRHDGHVDGLHLDAGGLLVVRDYDGDPARLDSISRLPSPVPPIPITVDQNFVMGPGGTLRMVFEADAWDSTISFAPGIPVTLDGTLELTFSDEVNLASQIGRTFDLFDWTGVTPTGTFAISSPYSWDFSNLYENGEVKLRAVPEPQSVLLLFSALVAFVSIRDAKHSVRIAAVLFVLLASAGVARADIYQWEYINPADPSQGKRQSTMLASQGAGVDAAPGAHLFGRDLTMAYLIDADLTNAYMHWVNLTEADLSRANLTDAALGNDLFGSTLTNANFADAQVHGASFFSSNLTADQLYSTASYKARDLSRIRIDSDLVGVNLAGQNLTAANFGRADLTGANFRQAILTNAAFSAQYYNCGHTNSLCMPSTSLRSATLTDADFTDAEVRGANFNRPSASDGTGITLAQLYSTASYQAGDLSGIGLSENNLAGGNFADQNLAHADFGIAMLAGANFRGANLANASFQKVQFVPCFFGICDWSDWYVYTENATLTDADFTGADARGAIGLDVADATTANMIGPGGRVDGLNLDAGGLLVVRDYDGDPARMDSNSFLPAPVPPIPITVDKHFAMAPGGMLRMLFEADEWDSTISLAPGIPVTLGGTLELTFADDVNLASQVGRTFDLFDWTGVTPSGAFAISSPYAWDLTNLYTSGEVTLTAVPEPATCLASLVWFLGLTFSRRSNMS